MATTGTYAETLDNDDFITEAFERITVDPEAITGRHIASAIRSLKFMLTDWETKGVKQWKIERFEYTSTTSPAYTTSAQSMTLPGRIIRVLWANHKRDGVETPLHEVGRTDYEALHKKDQSGSRPDRYFLDRQRDAPLLYLWPTLDNTSSTLIFLAFIRTEDVGNMSNSLDIPRIWFEALASGLAARLAEKYKPEMWKDKLLIADQKFKNANAEDRDTGSTKLVARFRGRRGK